MKAAMARSNRDINLPAPYLKRVWLDEARVVDPKAYPFCLPFLKNGFELEFDHPITIIVGENGTGKSTILEGIASLAGYDEAGGGKGYRPVDHSTAVEAMGGSLARALRGQAGYRRSPRAGSFMPRASSLWPDTLIVLPSNRSRLRRIFFPTLTERVSCAFSTRDAGGKASSYSMSLNPHFLRPGKSSFSSCCGEWTR